MTKKTDFPAIKKFLKAKGFYSYLDTAAYLDAVRKELAVTASFKNKRNIQTGLPWEKIVSLGRSRPLLVIELGGSFLQLIRLQITGNKIKINDSRRVDFYDKNKTYTPESLFSGILDRLDEFIPPGQKKHVKDCVFIFTFPIKQYVRNDGVIDAVAVKINKQIHHKGIVGIKVGKTFEKFARSRGYTNIVATVTNDTIPSLLAAKYAEINSGKKFDAALIVIVGTGTNVAAGFNIRHNRKKNFYMVNTEYAYFGSFPGSEFDRIFALKCENPNESLAEKMISGIWQPYLFEIIVREMVAAGLVDRKITAIFKAPRLNAAALEKKLAAGTFPPAYNGILDIIWLEQTKRGAFLTGVMLALTMILIAEQSAGAKKISLGLVEVGGVISNARLFRKEMHKTIREILKKLDYTDKIHYTSVMANNVSAEGSAVFDSIIRQ